MELINHNDNFYIPVRRITRDRFKMTKDGVETFDMPFVKEYMEFLNCDHVLQTDQVFIFCRSVIEVEYKNVEDLVLPEEVINAQ